MSKKHKHPADDLTRDAADVGAEALAKLIRMQTIKKGGIKPLSCITALIAFNIVSAARFTEDFYEELDKRVDMQFRVISVVMDLLSERFPEIVQEVSTVEGVVKSFEMPAEKGVH